MSKLAAAFWLGLVAATGFTTFKVKYAVQDIGEELNRVRKHTIAEQQEVRVLAAEWTYLTQPERLAELNRRFLQMAPVAMKQLQSRIEDLPLRAPPAPPPDIVVGAHTAPPTAAASMPQPTSPPAVATVAAPASPAPVASAAPVPNRALAAAAALLAPRHAIAASRPPVQLAKAAANPLDALFAQIAERH